MLELFASAQGFHLSCALTAGVAETGSGKTAAFLIPLLTYVMFQAQEVRDRVSEQVRGHMYAWSEQVRGPM